MKEYMNVSDKLIFIQDREGNILFKLHPGKTYNLDIDKLLPISNIERHLKANLVEFSKVKENKVDIKIIKVMYTKGQSGYPVNIIALKGNTATVLLENGMQKDMSLSSLSDEPFKLEVPPTTKPQSKDKKESEDYNFVEDGTKVGIKVDKSSKEDNTEIEQLLEEESAEFVASKVVTTVNASKLGLANKLADKEAAAKPAEVKPGPVKKPVYSSLPYPKQRAIKLFRDANTEARAKLYKSASEETLALYKDYCAKEIAALVPPTPAAEAK